jgi:hypothetical protein
VVFNQLSKNCFEFDNEFIPAAEAPFEKALAKRKNKTINFRTNPEVRQGAEYRCSPPRLDIHSCQLG